MYSFEDLEAWKSARELRKVIALLVKSFPPEEKYRLTDQITRSSRSVTNNISEGLGRFHYQENIQFCRQARGSLMETLDHLICANDDGYIKEDDLKNYKEKIFRCNKILRLYFLSPKSQEFEHCLTQPIT